MEPEKSISEFLIQIKDTSILYLSADGISDPDHSDQDRPEVRRAGLRRETESLLFLALA